ncbi:polysaccharide pyruvyl transferase family protein [Marinomonas communis]|uniref:Polysaccharide pyruvyl transferase n=1 Tax=Marinomonas communis TaxID=28254 RepID=A0A4R6X6X7_9GAMM|nr:polysaccharide pyruvyl transferase family protein [Marinomonas communis]TDR13074.1 polysaccharide pyruvyl transferase [Marinomonas communis]
MKKVGLLSFPTAINHGAYLQVFALKKQLEDFGLEVKVLNYRNKRHYYNELRSLFFKKNFSVLFINLKRFYKFRKAQKRFEMSGMTFDSEDLKTKELDLVSIGADIVWNYGTPFLGYDPIYFGQGLNSKRVISYAPSMGDSDISELPDYVKNNITNFSHVSARDENTKKITEMMFQTCPLVLDPTLLINWEGYEIDAFRYSFEYILVYAFSYTESDKLAILKLAEENGLRIVSICFNEKLSWCHENIMVLDPLEFLSIYSKAKYVFTSTFHGLLFSLKYEKQFVLRDNKTVHNKVSTIIKLLDLHERVIAEDKSVDEIYGILTDEINYEKVNDTLDSLIEDSKRYLKYAIENRKYS